ncbi:S41 family peptidase [Ramlibacter humi]|uniref:Peptidase S41 n=1 Tax=Ramlibacter humi TaxID=2530451 RepID=A0A4Z0BIG0_9BURK|nr:S41 family peptidase [Ramlibacter humi]TFY99102.1 hypothetical protein EZ216_16210 [Ramlibacter humi]
MLQVPSLRHAAAFATTFVALTLAACGGGGGGGSSSDTASGAQLSSSLANQCGLPDQQRWLQAYMGETYLWNDEMPSADAAGYSDMSSYFNALLVKTTDANGRARDRFSTVMTATSADAMQNVRSGNATPSVLTSNTNPVPMVRTMTSRTGRKVGYLLFNEHSRGAQDALIAAFTSLKAANVQELVLDLRYNSGGFIYIAQAAAAMVAGPSVDGQIFESVRYNTRRTGENAAGTFWYSNTVTVAEDNYPAGTALPQLSLPRLYVLTSQLTCSASESIINSLRGIGVQVVLIGDRTCGKPYGFHRKDNCGSAYFPIEFQVYNAQGFGEYQAGFPVQCRVREDATKALGASNEPLLAAAVNYIDTGACPAGTGTGVQFSASASTLQQSADGGSIFDRAGAPPADSPMYQAGWDGRRLQP